MMGEQIELEALEGERGPPNVHSPGLSTAGRSLILLVLVVVVGLAAAGLIYLRSQSDHEIRRTNSGITSTVPQRTFVDPPSPPVERSPPPLPRQQVALPQVEPTPAPTSVPPLPGKQDKPKPSLDKSASSVMVTGARKQRYRGVEKEEP